jgi:hypothetical protein
LSVSIGAPPQDAEKKLGVQKAEPHSFFAKLVLAVSSSNEGTVAFERVHHVGDADFRWIFHDKVNVILVVVKFHKNQIQTLGGKIESVAKTCPDRVRNRRMAVFHDENQMHE